MNFMITALYLVHFSSFDHEKNIQFDKVFVAAHTVEKALELFRGRHDPATVLQISRESVPVILP